MNGQFQIVGGIAENDSRWVAVRARDAGADGQFYYAVRTTGVYCRPSCAARTPRRENVRFFATAAAAEQAGFRPCKRCAPDRAPLAVRQAELVAGLCRQIEAAETPPTLDTLAKAAGISRFHLHRVFKALTGLTPKAYADAQRARRVREALADGAKVTAALYQAGYNASARFYEKSPQLLGMPAKRYRAGGERMTIRFAIGQCSLGAILVAASRQGVCTIAMGDDPEQLLRDLEGRFGRAELVGGDADFEAWVARVVGFVEAPQLGLDLPLDIRGSAFQQRVWQALREIPAGTTLSYTELAGRIGAPRAVRAVAAACAANPLAVVIPCHRVVRRDGGLAGYRWGIERKRALLEREAGE